MATSPTLERSAPAIPQTTDPRIASASSGIRVASRTGRIPLLSLVFAIGLTLFISIDPVQPYILLALTAIMALGADGIVRSHPRGEFHTVADTAPHLFVPVLYTLSAGLFLEDVILSYWAVPAVIGASVLFGAAVYAEHVSVETDHPSFPLARFVLNVVTYLTAFGFYAVVYGFDVDLVAAAFAVGMVSMLLAIEVFREAEADPIRSLVFAAVIGVIAGEARWVLYFIPLEGFLAGVFILLVFYLTTGVISHYLTHHLDRAVLAEFAMVTLAGLAIVIGGRAIGDGAPNLYLGIDLSGHARASGYAIVDANAALIDVGLVLDDAAILALGARPGVVAVAIDCPLGLPAGLCCLEESCACVPTNMPGLRLSERLVQGRGYGLYHTTKRSIIKALVYRGIALRRELESTGMRVMEVYPFATKAALFGARPLGRRMPKKTTPEGNRWLRERLSTHISGLDAITRTLTHDELDAVAAAYTALLLDRGEAEALGDSAEGAIVVPVAAAPAYTAST